MTRDPSIKLVSRACGSLTIRFDGWECQVFLTSARFDREIGLGRSVLKLRVLVVGAIVARITLAPTGNAAAQDPAKGEQIFKQCMVCHRVGDGAKNLIGPVLNNVIGRQAGTYEAFRYSALMKAAGENGLIWSEDLIVQYIADPSTFLKKYLADKGKADLATSSSLMTFKLLDEQQRKDVAAYEATFSQKK
jgi:cytochrome c